MAKKSFLIIFLSAFLLSLTPLAAPTAHAAASFVLSPASSLVSNGGQFSVRVVMNADQAVNAAQGTVTFPISRLRVLGISKTGSVLQFWSQEPVFSNFNGTINFGGGLPSPGFTGQNGTLFTITFQATAVGTATVNITEGAVLANDGRGTNVLQNISQGTYTINTSSGPLLPNLGNQITSQAYPNSNLWYNRPVADFAWTLVPGVDRVAYELVQAPVSEPSVGRDPVDHTEYSLEGKPDGIYYFHLQLRTRGAWGSVLTKRIKVDRTPPSAPVIQKTSNDPTDPRPAFVWTAADETSGIKAYRVRVGGGEWLVPTPASSASMTLPLQAPGKYALVVEAEDFAGNKSEGTTEFTVAPIAPPVILEYPRRIASALTEGETHESVAIAGVAPGAAEVKVYLRKSRETLEFNAPVAEDGTWRVSYTGALSGGTWSLTAQAVDARGARSQETSPILIPVGSFISNLINRLAGWGAVALVAILFLALSALAILAAWARLKHYHLKMKKEIMAAQVTLIKDFEQVEKDLDGSRTAKARRSLNQDMQAMAKDIGKELERLKKDVE